MLTKKIGVVVCALLLATTKEGCFSPIAWGEILAPSRETVTTDREKPKNQVTNGSISSDQAIRLVLQHNQEIAALVLLKKANEAMALQGALLPNPTLDLAVENFNGNGAVDGFDSAESTLSLSQLVELGGKRNLRRQTGGINVEIATLELQSRKLDLIAETRQAFIEILAYQERQRLAVEQLTVAQEIVNTVKARVQAGRVSPIELTKSKIEFSTSRINLNKINRELSASRKRLARYWGSTELAFNEAAGRLMEFHPAPSSLDQLLSQVDDHPQIKKLTAIVGLSRAQEKLAQAQRIPDMTVSGGYRKFEESGDHAYVFAVSFPLSTFDRNQGGIAKAGYDRSRAKAELSAARIRLKTEMSISHQELLSTKIEASNLTDEVLPAARNAFNAVQKGYQQGKFNYLEVLDAQKTLFGVSMGRIDAFYAYQASRVELERLSKLELNF